MPLNQPTFSRSALAPGLLGAIALLAGLAVLTQPEWYLFVQYIVSILAIIIAVFAVQAKQYLWLIGLVPVAILWNPVWPITIEGEGWLFLQFAACVIFVASGITIKVPLKKADR